MNTRKPIVSLALVALTAVARAAGFNSQSYVQDGLIAQFDAVENIGVGQHSDTATVWKDLKGNASINIPSGTKWIDRAFNAENVDLTAKSMPAFYLDSASTEVAMNAFGHSGYPRLFYHPSDDGFYTVHFNGTSSTLQFYINTQSTNRPSATFTLGTLGVATDTTNYRILVNGALKNTSGSSVISHKEAPSKDWTINRGDLSAYYRSFRHYNRGLSDAEFLANSWIDQIRFFSYQFTGTSTETPVAWSSLAWTAPHQSTLTAPSNQTNDIARIIGAKVSVTATDSVMLKGLSLEDGATLALDKGADICANVVFVECQRIERGFYTGPEGTFGTRVDWISGAGLLRVSGENATKFPVATTGIGAHSYVQAGLVTQFDAIENVAPGQAHDATAAKWLDLVGTASLTLTTNVTWREGRYFEKSGNGNPIYFGPMPAYKRDTITCDVPINIHESGKSTSGGYPRVFANAENFSIYFRGTSTEAQVYICNQPGDPRPNLGNFRIGTIAAFSGAKCFGGAVDGVIKAKTGAPATYNLNVNSESWGLGNAGRMIATYGGLRFYNRCLTADELTQNTLVDKFRFFSYRYVNTNEEAVAWANIPWNIPEGQTAAAPAALTNQYVTIVGGTVSVAATDVIALKGLSLENGAKLNVAEGGTIMAELIYLNGLPLSRGIYTAAGEHPETSASWIEGAGRVCVAGKANGIIPTVIHAPDSDGWHTFGLDGGKTFVNNETQKWPCIRGEHPIWDNYLFPAGAKLRLKGHILLDPVPDVFDEYDTTALKCVYINGTRPYLANRKFVVPTDAIYRYVPGDWKDMGGYTNMVELGKVNSSTMAQATGDVELKDNGIFNASGDGMPNLTYSGLITGTGTLFIGNFGRQMRFTGGFAANANGSESWQNGSGIWFDTLTITNSLKTIWLCNCDGRYGTNVWYSASFLIFGKNDSDATADHPLSIATLNGNASSRLDVPSGHRWRSGGHLLVWGSNTVHIGTLNKGLHVFARHADQDCNGGFLSSSNYKAKGIGFVEIENFASGTIFGSTNVALTVGTVASGTTFDYTYQADNVNRLTLDITGNCAENATVMATDLAMLPARVSGFRGSVKLTDTEEKTYEMPIDLTAGPSGVYNEVGCDGSGTLVAAPATSTVNVTFPTDGIEPVKGKYAIARFSAGGELLNGWNVTLNGEAVSETQIGNHLISLRRTSKGIYLGVDQPGLRVIVK